MVLAPLHHPDPRLREKAKPVAKITPEIKALAQDMLHSMYHYKGIGLAATQLGIPHRVVVMDLDVTQDMKPVSPKVYINPEIVSASIETSKMEEGCLSVASCKDSFKYITGIVTRPLHIRMRYLDLDGNVQEEEDRDMLARCMQHEIDHLDGILFIDRLEPEDRKRLIAELGFDTV